MKILFVLLLFVSSVGAQSVFRPEQGSYIYDQKSLDLNFEKNAPYIVLKKEIKNKNFVYKLDSKRNEFQVKNWYLQDWFALQDMYAFDQKSYIETYSSDTFTEAKRNQFSKLRFDKKKFYHYKEFPVLKEWGGLTHPPVKKLSLKLFEYDESFSPLHDSDLNQKFFNVQTQLEIDELSNSELTFKNELQVLVDNEAFRAKKKLIVKAKESILISSLVLVCDSSTKEIVNLLIRKHREGVKVFVIADGFMSKMLGHRSCLKQMISEGINLSETKDFFKHRLKAIYHTKALVVDLKEAIAGGHNMIDADNLSRGTDFKNRDVDLYVKGPMVTDIAKQFVENWDYQRNLNSKLSDVSILTKNINSKLKRERFLNLRGKEQYPNILGDIKTRMEGVCRFIKQAPYEDQYSIGKVYLKLLNQVTNHLVITDPIKTDTFSGNIFKKPTGEKWDSFKMFNQLHLKVQELARKNIKVDYITTNINMAGNENVAILNENIRNNLFAGRLYAANWNLIKLEASNDYYARPHYQNLMKDWMPYPNVHIWTHISFMHSKIFYFDRVAASIGSYNFQHNATDQAYESTAICMDRKLNEELDRVLVQDMVNSIPLIFSN